MEYPRLSVREAAVALALEQGRIQRDPSRRDSEEFPEIIRQRGLLNNYIKAHNIDGGVIANLVASIPQASYGPDRSAEITFAQQLPPERDKRWVAPDLAEVIPLHATQPPLETHLEPAELDQQVA